jgi:alpha-D-xyloside xylohydrolase
MFGEQALRICREWIRFRYSLLPYLWQVAHESAAKGWPVMRPLAFHYPDDRVARGVDDSFLLGRDVLVVPVFDDSEGPVSRSFYVPDGRWQDLHDGTHYAGPGFHTVDVPLDTMPVLVRQGAVIPRVEVDASVRGVADLIGRPWQLHAYGPGSATTTDQPLIGFDEHPAPTEGRTVVRHEF